MSTYNGALYTNSTLRPKPTTGQVASYFQHVPGETLDMDIVFERLLVHVDDHKWLFTAGKDAILWKLDRRTGAFVALTEMLSQDVFESIDRETGRLTYRQDIRDAGLWETRLGHAAQGFPITYEAGARQYVAVPADLGIFRGLSGVLSPEIYLAQTGNGLYVFALPE